MILSDPRFEQFLVNHNDRCFYSTEVDSAIDKLESKNYDYYINKLDQDEQKQQTYIK